MDQYDIAGHLNRTELEDLHYKISQIAPECDGNIVVFVDHGQLCIWDRVLNEIDLPAEPTEAQFNYHVGYDNGALLIKSVFLAPEFEVPHHVDDDPTYYEGPDSEYEKEYRGDGEPWPLFFVQRSTAMDRPHFRIGARFTAAHFLVLNDAHHYCHGIVFNPSELF